jgi:hypothetical protein
MTDILLDRFVRGRPAPFATAAVGLWKAAIATYLGIAVPDPRASHLELDFTIAPDASVVVRRVRSRRPYDAAGSGSTNWLL